MWHVLWIPLPLLIAAAVIDQRTRLISDAFPLALLVCAVVFNATGLTQVGWTGSLTGGLVGFLVGLGLNRAVGFGAGDAGLLLAIGALLGVVPFLVCLMLIAISGGLIAGVAKARGAQEIAYGPAIAAGYGLFVVLLGALAARASV